MQFTGLSLKKSSIYYPGKSVPVKFPASYKSQYDNTFQHYKTRDSGNYIQAAQQENAIRRSQNKEKRLEKDGISWEKYNQLKYGSVTESKQEQKLVEEMDAQNYMAENQHSRPPIADMEYNLKRNNEYIRALITRCKTIRTPGFEMYKKAQFELHSHRRELESIEKYRNQLEEETGLTSEQRLDAYFLGDESLFPDWARNLREAIRDRVLYGGIGLTEYDEIRRLKLLLLPMSVRRAKWHGIKQFRRQLDGTEKIITHSEKEVVAKCTRTHKWNLISRLERQIRLRIIETRNPKTTQWQVNMEEATDPIRTTAKYVRCGLPTCGSGQLDDELATKRLQLMEEDERLGAFVGKSKLMQGSIDPRVKSNLKLVDMWRPGHLKEKLVKRISRQCYKKRWGAILGGSRDEHGRKIVEERHVFPKFNAHKSFAEYAIERDEMGMPMPHARPPVGKSSEPWPGYYKYQNATLSVGLPKPNQGWY
ncbi:Phage-like tail protein [Perkinsela sp. CCAP 1560/4]|nr:Phage-like tail protein [Perkinsela sp. CCAP 1560/4]KNH08267.1 Phage-like tail protein [Perkinsela sp. CCAP 1560/4]|eukprot:KNH06969.1 Phage-like tail protein [Perkinsela sp. CCAP 1560/4]